MELKPTIEMNVKNICKNLLNGETFCFDNVKTRADYNFIHSYKDTISDRLETVGYQLICDEITKSAYVINFPETTEKYMNFAKLPTKLILFLLLKFNQTAFKLNDNTKAVSVSLEELINAFNDIESKKERDILIDNLWILKQRNFLTVKKPGSSIECTKKDIKESTATEDYMIIVYPTIASIIDADRASELANKINNFRNQQMKESLKKENENE